MLGACCAQTYIVIMPQTYWVQCIQRDPSTSHVLILPAVQSYRLGEVLQLLDDAFDSKRKLITYNGYALIDIRVKVLRKPLLDQIKVGLSDRMAWTDQVWLHIRVCGRVLFICLKLGELVRKGIVNVTPQQGDSGCALSRRLSGMV